MKIFRVIGSALRTFFHSSAAKAIAKHILAVLGHVVDKLSDQLYTVAKEEVYRAELSGESGAKKYEAAFKAIRGRFSPEEFKDSAIDFALHGALMEIDRVIADNRV